ncbi:hypothetical protein [Xanthomonas arboricola]|uniref:Uncharacterized protein n=1 Tax=Xanthomonas arboricola pv. guizotiae TaxID=487867 RepID=A0A2S7A6S1_9XANT|nr:hypothetical protein XarbCFBP7409_03165 [Xanthomonas arboricola pv. guizotiae]PPU24436.1 hypothetical protein XarbCFBP7408_08825 [Xanthomonas arboricola pv. guizotiae]
MKSGQTVQVRRSSRDLEVTCVLPGQRNAAGRSISRANIGIWGNILIGGAIGAIVDHSKGTGYTYPSWIQLVFGQTLSFDRHREDRGQPLQGDNAQGRAVAITAASGGNAPSGAVTLPLAGVVAPPAPGSAAAPAGHAAATVAPAGPAMSTESAMTRAQSVSSGLNCGAVQAHSATRFTAACSGGSTLQIDCAGFRCSASFP